MPNPHPKIQWKKGQSGNPKGRPKKGETLTDLLKEYIVQLTDVEAGGKVSKVEIKKAFIMKVVQKAINDGDVNCMRMIWDRLEGMPVKHIEMHNEKDAEWLELFKGIDDRASAEASGNTPESQEAEPEDTDT